MFQHRNLSMSLVMGPYHNSSSFQLIWNFFATSHGKGVVDGIGGTEKITNSMEADQSERAMSRILKNKLAWRKSCVPTSS